jgi:DNA adenine methylase
VTALAQAQPAQAEAHPFIKFVGGKRQLLPSLIRHVPAKFGTYHEPFVGGGALFFQLQPKRAILSDLNRRLVRTYRGVCNSVEDVIALLKTYPYDRDFYYRMREQNADAMQNHELAAWFIYLNKACFNGLYRVNRSGKFNVAFGRYTNPTICDELNLRACSAALQSAQILHSGFESVLERAEPGDFVYCDPPYVPVSSTSSFVSYTAEGFTTGDVTLPGIGAVDDQRRLRDVALALKRKGVHVLLSNSASPAVRELYRDGFEIEEVGARRAVNCKAESRGEVKELLIW